MRSVHHVGRSRLARHLRRRLSAGFETRNQALFRRPPPHGRSVARAGPLGPMLPRRVDPAHVAILPLFYSHTHTHTNTHGKAPVQTNTGAHTRNLNDNHVRPCRPTQCYPPNVAPNALLAQTKASQWSEQPQVNARAVPAAKAAPDATVAGVCSRATAAAPASVTPPAAHALQFPLLPPPTAQGRPLTGTCTTTFLTQTAMKTKLTRNHSHTHRAQNPPCSKPHPHQRRKDAHRKKPAADTAAVAAHAAAAASSEASAADAGAMDATGALPSAAGPALIVATPAAPAAKESAGTLPFAGGDSSQMGSSLSLLS